MDLDALTLRLDGMLVSVLRGGTSRRAKLTIERDGSLQLKAARDVERVELEQFLASKRDWIYRKLADKELLAGEPMSKELVDGEGFLYLGRSYRLRIVNTDDSRIRLHRGRLILPEELVATGRERIIEWYRATGLSWLEPRAKEWAQRIRVTPAALEVGDLGNKWGSALSGGRVRIHWATMQLRPTLVEYVLAHEIVHLREPHHGPAFWRLLGRTMPDFDERKTALAEAGTSIWMGILR
jgi:predicted metal-dependent hydrolase